MSSDVPDILKPFTLRSGIRYKSLSRHDFSVDKKNWVCQTLIAENIAQENVTYARYCYTVLHDI